MRAIKGKTGKQDRIIGEWGRGASLKRVHLSLRLNKKDLASQSQGRTFHIEKTAGAKALWWGKIVSSRTIRKMV